MFALRVEFLTGRCVAKETHQRAEWPPHPARLFSTLVSALYVRVPDGEEPDIAELRALEWLQEQGPPEIAFSSSVMRRTVVTHYVPINDVGLPDKTAEKLEADLRTASDGKAKMKANQKTDPIAAAQKALRDAGSKALRFLPERQSGRKPRTFPTIRPDNPAVHYLWPNAEGRDHRDGFVGVISRVAYLGHSSSLVSIGIVEHCNVVERWTPHQRGEKLRSFAKQQLQALQQVFPVNERAEQSYRLPFEAISYGPKMDEASTVKLAFSPDWIVFRKLKGPELPIKATLDLTRAFRRLVLNGPRAATLSNPAKQLLSGHAGDGSPLQEDHVAWIALPFVGRRYARGSGLLKGLAVVLPSLLNEAKHAGLADEILATLEVGSSLEIAGIGKWKIERVRAGEHNATLDPETWTRPAMRWATVTPLMLDRHPGHLFGRAAKTEAQVKAREKARLEAEESVSAACIRLGLPAPMEISLSRYSSIVGAPPSHTFRAPPQRSGKPRRYYVHATLIFAEPAPGPLLLGAGRYFGFGLCKPVEETR